MIDELADLGREAYDADRRLRWSIERLWIFAGNLAERHCRETGVDAGVDPWSELVATRKTDLQSRPVVAQQPPAWRSRNA